TTLRGGGWLCLSRALRRCGALIPMGQLRGVAETRVQFVPIVVVTRIKAIPDHAVVDFLGDLAVQIAPCAMVDPGITREELIGARADNGVRSGRLAWLTLRRYPRLRRLSRHITRRLTRSLKAGFVLRQFIAAGNRLRVVTQRGGVGIDIAGRDGVRHPDDGVFDRGRGTIDLALKAGDLIVEP